MKPQSNVQLRRRVLAVIAMAAACTSASAQLQMHDDFSGRVLNLGKWQGGWFSEDAIELKRGIVKGKFQLGVYGVGGIGDSGKKRTRNRITLPDRLNGRISTIQSTLQMTRGSARYCESGTQESRGRLRQVVTWFNDGTSTGDDDATGDVASYIGLRAVPGTNMTQIRLWAWRCNDSNCSTVTDIPTNSTNLGEVRRNTPVVVRMTYKRGTNALAFYAKAPGKAAETREYSLNGIATSAGPSRDPFNVIEARAEADNCPAGISPRPYARVEGFVDNVKLRLFAN